jgi:aminopeptidase N
MSHPIRPNSYISMDNFYTATVYEKGAEVIKMYQTLLGVAGFRKGMDLYFERHDGSAVTCDDFRAAMSDANDNFDLTQFAQWYETPGTPTVKYSYEYDAEAGKLTLELTQSSKAVADTPLHIPVATGLLDKATSKEVVPTKVLNLTQQTQTFEFDGLKGDVVPSILRDFSAPVKLIPASGDEDEELLAFLAAHDTDGFNKWEAGQKLFTSCISKIMKGDTFEKTEEYVFEAFGNTLKDTTMDPAIKAYALILPSESSIAEDLEEIDPVGIRNARKQVRKSLARKFQAEIQATYDALSKDMEGEAFNVEAPARGRRSLRNTLLGYLCTIAESPEEQEAAAVLATAHYKAASGKCLTDQMAAFGCLASMSGAGAASTARDEAVQDFYEQAKDNALVLDKWFSTQAVADLPDVLDRVKALSEHPDFTLSNPNRCRSLVGAFTQNLAPFHAEDGSGYQFLSGILADLDNMNPQISSRLSNALLGGHRYNEARASLMRAELQKLADMKPISDDLFEKVNKGLNF